MTKTEIQAKIEEMDAKLVQQLEDVQGRRGMREDVVKLMVPALRDQLALMRSMLELTSFGLEFDE